MHPILVELGPLTIYSYGVIVALAFIIGTIWTLKRAEQSGENADHYLYAILWIAISGIAGARLMYVVYYPELYINDPLRIIFDRGGLVWYGGLISAVAASLIYAKVKKLYIPKFGDILIAPTALGLAIGRLGCFAAGCCYGKPTTVPWGVQFPSTHETYPDFLHPTQLYESFALILLTLILQYSYKRSKLPGVTMSLFFIGYGIIRFIIEHFRGDGIYWIGHLTASQIFSLAGILAGILVIWILRRPLKNLKEISVTKI